MGRRWRLIVALGAVAVGAVAPGAATASMPLASVVSTNPANFTPNVASGAVYKFIQLNGVLYAGGSFSSVSTATGVSPGGTFTRHNLVAFNPTTGVITAFSPDIDGAVWALATDGTSLYVGGTFSSVNGVARRGLAKLDPAPAPSTRPSTPASPTRSRTPPWSTAASSSAGAHQEAGRP
jgi:hypothetical protein